MNSISELKEFIANSKLEEISNRLGVSQATASRWKNGKGQPGLDELQKFEETKKESVQDQGDILPPDIDNIPEESLDVIPSKQMDQKEDDDLNLKKPNVRMLTPQPVQEDPSIRPIDLSNPPPGYRYEPELNEAGQNVYNLVPIPGYVPHGLQNTMPVRDDISKTNPFNNNARAPIVNPVVKPLNPPRNVNVMKAVPVVARPKNVGIVKKVEVQNHVSAIKEQVPVVEPSLPRNLVDLNNLNKEMLNRLRDVFFNWKGKNICILAPFHKHTNPGTLQALMSMCLDLGKEKAHYFVEHGDAMIYNSRNMLAHKFLYETEAEWSFWIDDDMIPPVGREGWFRKVCNLPHNYPKDPASMHVIERLMGHYKTMVGAIYFGRQMYGPPMFGEMMNPEANEAARKFTNQLRSTEWVGTGCVLVHRSVYLDIMKKFPHLDPQGVGDPDSGESKFQFFKPEIGIHGGEDVVFSHRAREAGHEVYIDLGCHIGHVGYSVFHSLNTTNKSKNPNRTPYASNPS